MAVNRYGKHYGVDKGTTSDAIAVYSPLLRKVITLSNWDGECTIPSDVVPRTPLEKSLYGKAAKNSKEVHCTISSAKSSVPKKIDVTKEGVEFDVKNIISISASMTRAELEEVSGVRIEKGVLTYPAEWNEERQKFYKEAVSTEIRSGRDDFQVLAMLPESVAAGFSYKPLGGNTETIGVCDIGGGTTDLALLTMGMKNGVEKITVHSVHGRSYAGDDWTEAIISFFKRQLDKEGVNYEKDIKLLKELRQESEKIKMEMPGEFHGIENENGDMEFDEYGEKELLVFSNVNRKFVRLVLSTEDYVRIFNTFDKEEKKTMNEFTKKIEGFRVNTVLLVGGSCSNPFLQKSLKKYFTQGFYKDVRVIAHKEKVAVAIGAAYYAHWIFDEKKEIVIENNVTGSAKTMEEIPEIVMECSDSIGIKGLHGDGKYRIGNVIYKGRKLPCSGSRMYGAKPDRDTGIVKIEVYMNYSNLRNVELYEAKCYIGTIELDLLEFHLQDGESIPIEIKLSVPAYGIIELEAFHDQRKLKKATLILGKMSEE